MVRFWFVDVKKWKKIDGWLVRSEALEAVADGADGLRIVAPSGTYTNAAYVAAEAIENDDTSYKYWDDQFYSITEVCLDEKDF
jgi:hypothetical protein